MDRPSHILIVRRGVALGFVVVVAAVALFCVSAHAHDDPYADHAHAFRHDDPNWGPWVCDPDSSATCGWNHRHWLRPDPEHVDDPDPDPSDWRDPDPDPDPDPECPPQEPTWRS